ncbi:hypothetical protein [Nonomuraea sp. NPDC050310]|uniref:putative phage holin n=1 Tax=Nonomuraea sp. NPDC050310 TaxID=3154935 RepID=UPI0033E8260A
MDVELVRHLGTVEIVVTMAMAWLVVITHHLLSRWSSTPGGRHAFTFELVLAACLSLWAVRLIVPDGDWFLVVRLVVFGGVPLVLFWRWLIIVRVWRTARRQRTKTHEEDPHE